MGEHTVEANFPIPMLAQDLRDLADRIEGDPSCLLAVNVNNIKPGEDVLTIATKPAPDYAAVDDEEAQKLFKEMRDSAFENGRTGFHSAGELLRQVLQGWFRSAPKPYNPLNEPLVIASIRGYLTTNPVPVPWPSTPGSPMSEYEVYSRQEPTPSDTAPKEKETSDER